MGPRISDRELEYVRERHHRNWNSMVQREAKLSAGERVVATKHLLRDHGVRCINQPTVGGPLGGGRGMYLRASHRGIEFTAYHPSQPERRKLLRDTIAVITAAGWRIEYDHRPSPWKDGRREPFIRAYPRGRHPWGPQPNTYDNGREMWL